MRRAILHIGAIKTGSTTIQRALAANRAQLLANGVAFAESPGHENHLALAVHAVPDRTRELWRFVGMAGDEEAFGAHLEAALAAEMAALPAEVRTVIFSNEHCQLTIGRRDEVERLKALLAPHFDTFRIVLYVRRQDRLVVSAYNEHLKEGGTDRDIFARLEEEWRDCLDYAGRLAIWADVFGRDSIRVRVFSRPDFVEHDLLADFCHAADIAVLRPEELQVPAQNLSLRADAQRVLRWCNAWFGAPRADEGWQGRLRDRLLRRLRRDLTGRGCLPSEARARAFLRHFDAANERLRAAWFPDRAAVFDDAFTHYPAEESRSWLWRDLCTVGLAMAGATLRSRRAALSRRIAGLWSRPTGDAELPSRGAALPRGGRPAARLLPRQATRKPASACSTSPGASSAK